MLGAGRAPDHQFIIIAAAGELVIVEAPFEPTNFLFVAYQFRNVMGVGAHISEQDVSVPGASGKHAAAPGGGAHPPSVAEHGSDVLAMRGIPDLGLSGRSAH